MHWKVERRRFEDNIISLWEDYIAVTRNAPPPTVSAAMPLADLVFQASGWVEEREENVAAFHAFCQKSSK